jgi:hypothetical protein
VTSRHSSRLPQPGELPSIVFRALFPEFELRTLGGLHVAVPKGTPWYAGYSLGEVARQISTAPSPGTDSGPGGQPSCSPARST